MTSRRRKPAKKQVVRGTKLAYNAAAQKRYEQDLKDLLRSMAKEVTKQLTALFEKPVAEEFYEQQKQSAQDASIASQAKILTNKLSDKFRGLFEKKGKKIAEKMVNNSDKISATNLSSSLKKLSGDVTLKTNFSTPALKEMSQAAVTENVGLITSIADKYLSDVNGAVMRSITTGNGLKDLIPALNQYKGISERRATNIALDQTRKVYNMVNKGRMEKVGVKKFEWIHSGGGSEPRKSHQAMDGKIYSFDRLPVINKEEVDRGKAAVRGIPGQAINCGCTMAPVLEFDEEEEG